MHAVSGSGDALRCLRTLYNPRDKFRDGSQINTGRAPYSKSALQAGDTINMCIGPWPSVHRSHSWDA